MLKNAKKSRRQEIELRVRNNIISRGSLMEEEQIQREVKKELNNDFGSEIKLALIILLISYAIFKFLA